MLLGLRLVLVFRGDSDGFDLDHHIKRQAGNFNCRTGRLDPREVRTVDCVQDGKIVEVFQKNRRFDDAIQPKTLLLQYGRQVSKALTHLGLKVAFDNPAGCRVQRNLTRDINEWADPDRRRVRRSLQRPAFRMYRFFFHVRIMAAITSVVKSCYNR